MKRTPAKYHAMADRAFKLMLMFAAFTLIAACAFFSAVELQLPVVLLPSGLLWSVFGMLTASQFIRWRDLKRDAELMDAFDSDHRMR